jgi:hypothetical protein
LAVALEQLVEEPTPVSVAQGSKDGFHVSHNT